MRLRPFFRYFGGKWRAADTYPPPRHGTIVEPFAGAAGYAMRYPDRQVILVDRYHVIAAVWRWLIGASADDVRAIPLVENANELPEWVPQGARWLVGFSMNVSARPTNILSSGRRMLREQGRHFEGWSPALRERVACQVDRIRHWRVIEGDYSEAPDVEATWFIDPPYQIAGRHYTHGSDAIDYQALGDWCRGRRGQVLVCEAQGADWLPFRPHALLKASNMNATTAGVSAEALWSNEAPPVDLFGVPA